MNKKSLSMILSASASFWVLRPFSKQRCITQHPCLSVPMLSQLAMHALKMNQVNAASLCEPSASISSGVSDALNATRMAYSTWFPLGFVDSQSTFLSNAFPSDKISSVNTNGFLPTTSIKVYTALVPWMSVDTQAISGITALINCLRQSTGQTSINFQQRQLPNWLVMTFGRMLSKF